LRSEVRTLRDHLSLQARRLEKKTFLEFEEQRFSYRAVDEMTDRVATGLTRLGLAPGERLALLVGDRPELLFFLWGAPKVGIVPAPLDPALDDAGLRRALEQITPGAIVVEERSARRAAELPSAIPSIRHVIAVDPEPSFQAFARAPALDFWPDLDPEAGAAILFTSVRVAAPKPVLLSHTNLLSNAGQMLQPLRVHSGDRFYGTLPLASPGGLVLQLLAPWFGGAMVRLSSSRGAAGGLLAELAGRRSTVLIGTPELFGSAASEAAAEPVELTSLRLAACYPGPASGAMHRQFQESFDALVVEGYGLTEATCLTCVNPYTGIRKPGSLGIPLPGQECRIVDGDSRSLPAGTPGEIVVRGSNVMKEYFGDPAATAAVLRDGWLHTGDTGFVDGDGYYHRTPTP
jgi:long-chain acyl-CoA synthetase